MIETVQICAKCGVSQPIDEYYTDRTGPRRTCKDCHRAQVRAYKAKNREKVLEANRVYNRSDDRRYTDRDRKRKALHYWTPERVRATEKRIRRQKARRDAPPRVKSKEERDNYNRKKREKYWANRDQILAAGKAGWAEYHKKTADNLTDAYVRKHIKKRLGRDVIINQEMIDIKRDQLKLHRELRETRRLLNGADRDGDQRVTAD